MRKDGSRNTLTHAYLSPVGGSRARGSSDTVGERLESNGLGFILADALYNRMYDVETQTNHSRLERWVKTLALFYNLQSSVLSRS